MTQDLSTIKNNIMNLLMDKNKKEYFCHIQFVVELALKLADQHNVNKTVIELACLLHDVGRHREIDEEKHEVASARIAPDLLKDSDLTEDEKSLIIKCVRNHSDASLPQSVEEKIVFSADKASKILYHSQFLLACKRIDYDDKASWGIKHLNKSFPNIFFDDLKSECKPIYEELINNYNKVINKK